MVVPTAMTRQSREPRTDTELWDDFSLMHGGPLRRAVWALGVPRSAAGFVGFGIATALLAWVPLFILTAANGTLTSGSAVPFLSSIGTHVRLLLALPLLVVAEEVFDHSARKALRTIVRSGVVPPEQLPRLRQALLEAAWWRDNWLVEIVLAVIAVIFIAEGVRTDLPGDLTTWRTVAEGQRTLAAWWNEMVSLLWFQFLIWRFIVRLLIWGRLLWRIRGLDLQLVPTHPDLCGGLGPLAWPHVSLAPYSFALSSILVATFAEQVMQGRDVREAVMPTVVVVVLNTIALVAPLLLFAPKLIQNQAARRTRLWSPGRRLHACVRPEMGTQSAVRGRAAVGYSGHSVVGRPGERIRGRSSDATRPNLQTAIVAARRRRRGARHAARPLRDSTGRAHRPRRADNLSAVTQPREQHKRRAASRHE